MRQQATIGRLDVLAMGLLRRQVSQMDPGTQAVMGLCGDLLQSALTGLMGPGTGVGHLAKRIVTQGQPGQVQPAKAKAKPKTKAKAASHRSSSVRAYTKPQGPPDWSQPAVEVEAELIEG